MEKKEHENSSYSGVESMQSKSKSGSKKNSKVKILDKTIDGI